MHKSNSVRCLVVLFGMLGGLVLLPTAARASEIFPPAIQQAAGLTCTPSCTLCHTTNPGNIVSWRGKPFGAYMGTHGTLVQQIPTLLAAFNMYKADPAQAQGLMRLQEGVDPDTGDSLCGPTYGCGAHIAKKAPPSDLSSPLWVVGAMVIGGLLRRRKREA